MGRTRFMITSLTAHFTRIAVGDCRDGILFYSYHEVSGNVCFSCDYDSLVNNKREQEFLSCGFGISLLRLAERLGDYSVLMFYLISVILCRSYPHFFLHYFPLIIS